MTTRRTSAFRSASPCFSGRWACPPDLVYLVVGAALLSGANACGDHEARSTNAAKTCPTDSALAGASAVAIDGPETKSQQWRNVPIVGGGFVTGIIYNASEPGLVYARTDVGGLYRRERYDEPWIALSDWVGFDDVDLTGIESVASDPVDPDRLYVAAGLCTNY